MPEYPLSKLAEFAQTKLRGNPDIKINNVGSLPTAKSGQITFFSDLRYSKWLKNTPASAVILKAEDHHQVMKKPVLITADPYLAFARVATLFSIEPQAAVGIDPSATIAANCKIGEQVAIAAGVHLGENVTIGERTAVGANCTIGANSVIGADCKLHANVSVAHHVRLGNRVVVHSGAVIGADGFGITQDENQRWIKMPQCGSVVLHDDVEVGANTTIDRGTVEDTVLEQDVQIDNLVQIAHNVRIGRHTAIAGCSGIAGSAKIGKNCLIGGGSKINGHIEICDRAIIAGGSIVLQSVITPGKHTEWNLHLMVNQKLRKQQHQLIKLKKHLQYLEEIVKHQDKRQS